MTKKATKKKKSKKKIHINTHVRSANLFLITTFLLFAVCLYRVGVLALSDEIDGKNLKQFAASRTTAHDAILAKRGTIYDVHGEILAQNVYSYTLIAYLAESRGENYYVQDKEMTAEKLSTVLNLSKEQILSYLNRTTQNGEVPYQVEFGSKGKGLTEITKEKIVALNLPGIDFIESQKRYYPKGDFLSYTLGYAKLDETGKIIGELGIESLYNEELTGTDGYKEYQKDLKGYKIVNTQEHIQDAIDGNSIYLTIDSNVQFFLEQALENAVGNYHFDELNIVVADAKTGKILGLSSSTSFDPNLRNLTSYLDPNISIAVEPGSTMKIFSYMAAMEAGKYNGEETFKSGTYVTEDGTEIGDWKREGWGYITYDRGFALSSNIGVVNLIAKYMNRNILKDYYKKLGFGSKTGIELSKEVSGKLDFRYETEVLNAGFGQGIMTTSIQNIKALTSIANDGILLQPYIVDKIVDSKGNVIKQNTREELGRIASKQTTDKMKELMEQVVLNGTGSSYYMDGYHLIAKTGTAQIASENGTGYLKGANDVIRGFAGMFPKEDPQIIIYANVKRPNPNSPSSLVSVIKEVVENISKYYNIYNDPVETATVTRYKIDNYVNQSVEKVETALEVNGLDVIVIGDGDKIISQSPNEKVTLSKGNKIFLVTSGTNYIVPNLSGWCKKDVKTYMDLVGVPYTTEGTGYLIGQSIPEGTLITNEMEIHTVFKPKYEETNTNPEEE